MEYKHTDAVQYTIGLTVNKTMRSFNPSKRKGKTREIKETTVFTLTTFSFLWLLFVCIVLHCSIVHHSEECGVSVCLQGNGQCSPGKENSRILADMSTPNGQTVPRGANSPDGECSINRNILMWSAKWRFTMSLTQCVLDTYTLSQTGFSHWFDNTLYLWCDQHWPVCCCFY